MCATFPGRNGDDVARDEDVVDALGLQRAPGLDPPAVVLDEEALGEGRVEPEARRRVELVAVDGRALVRRDLAVRGLGRDPARALLDDHAELLEGLGAPRGLGARDARAELVADEGHVLVRVRGLDLARDLAADEARARDDDVAACLQGLVFGFEAGLARGRRQLVGARRPDGAGAVRAAGRDDAVVEGHDVAAGQGRGLLRQRLDLALLERRAEVVADALEGHAELLRLELRRVHEAPRRREAVVPVVLGVDQRHVQMLRAAVLLQAPQGDEPAEAAADDQELLALARRRVARARAAQELEDGVHRLEVIGDTDRCQWPTPLEILEQFSRSFSTAATMVQQL